MTLIITVGTGNRITGSPRCSASKPGGVLAVWSVREDRRFEQRLRAGSFDVTVERARGRLKNGGPLARSQSLRTLHEAWEPGGL